MADYKKPDYWQLKARKEGYPARSVYKLKEIDEKFGLLKTGASSTGRGLASNSAGEPGRRVLDLGAAPGSWSLYVLRKIAGNGLLVSADIFPLSRRYDRGLFDGDNFFFVQGDITDPAVQGLILSRGPYSLIISDAAPATSGNHSVDAARSQGLAGTVLDYAEKALAKGGHLVIKVFQGGDTAELLKRIKTFFATAKSFKPQACRGESFETYYIGMGRIQNQPVSETI
ncbi:MAG: RlmE family RNA methyltransferase [Treponema sp.]|jgi:23S rRNA (uridine2552-2'-O)-methyltransferase|nr:RlmE family RNA methyltransferase [Treponema sp.]